MTAVALCAAMLSGCFTAAGYAIGSEFPKHRGRPAVAASLEACEKPRVVFNDRSRGGEPVIGKVRGHDARVVLVRAEDERRTIMWKDVRAVRCHAGTYAGQGALIGGPLDAVAATVWLFGLTAAAGGHL